MTQLLLPFAKYKYLLFQLTQREIKARYKQSFVGRAWVVVNPLAQLIVYSFVFSLVFKSPSDGIAYPLFLLSGLLPWSLFQGSLTIATNSLVENAPLIRKVAFPREVIPYSVIVAKIVDFAFASLLFLVFAFFFRTPILATALLLPFVLFVQILLTTGLALMLAAFNLFYRDVQYLANLVLMLWMYMTPIVYPIDLVPIEWRSLYILNPMVGIISAYKVLLFGGSIDVVAFGWSAFASIIVFLLGFSVFKQLEKVFADIA